MLNPFSTGIDDHLQGNISLQYVNTPTR